METLSYINIKAVVALGVEHASIIAEAYASETESDKLIATQNILDSTMSKEAKIKFIGDMLTRPKVKRLAIAKKILEELC